MEIIVEVHAGKDGRPEGTVRSTREAEGRSFSGNLEFLALVEDLYLGESSTAPSQAHQGAEFTDDNRERTEQ
jgi:hypothetical protein